MAHLTLATSGAMVGEWTPLDYRADSTRGRGRITDIVDIKGAPNIPVSRRVRLYRDKDGAFLRETWSAPVTGVYSFNWLNLGERFTVISYDHTLDHRAVVADNLTPEAMP